MTPFLITLGGMLVCPIAWLAGDEIARRIKRWADRREQRAREQDIRQRQAVIALAVSNPDMRGDQLTQVLRDYMKGGDAA